MPLGLSVMAGRRGDRLRVLSALTGGATAVAITAGLVALLGWVLDEEALKSVVPGHVAMKANTALSLVALGGSLWLLRESDAGRPARLAQAVAALVGAFALATFSQYLHHRDLGIDHVLFTELPGAAGTSHAGRMAPNTALAFVLLSGALLTLDRPVRGRWTTSPTLAAVAGAMALLALLGYASGVTSLYGLSRLTQMAVPTAVAILGLAVAIVFARPTRGIVHIFVADTPGGTVARRLIPAAIGVPLVLGALRLAGENAGLYGAATGVWLFAISLICLLVPLILILARTLDRLDADRGQALAESAAERRAREVEQNAQVVILERLAVAAEYRDDETGHHTRRVGELSACIAQALGFPEDRVELIRQVAPLHDVGKIGVPDAVLLKPGRLTPQERQIVNTHTTVGCRMLQRDGYELLELAAEIAVSHHERWDGTGYPFGRAGDDIPIAGRIVAVADVFDALTHDRPYKAAWPAADAIAEIRSQRGRQFDPQVVDAFLEVCGDQGYLGAEAAPASALPELPVTLTRPARV